jgi:uncharacterized membrane protein (UPF0127 family)
VAKKKPVRHKEKSNPVKAGIKPLYQIIAVIAVLALIIFLAFPDLLKKRDYDDGYHFKKEGELTFYSADGVKKATIDIEIANTEYERELGLMKRKSMEENQGMLFIFPKEKMQSFWMRNTLISLDMMFVSAQKEIITIQKNTKVLSDQSYPSTKPAKYVIEVDAGFSARHNIKEGDKIRWKETKP